MAANCTIEVWALGKLVEYLELERWPTPDEEKKLESYFRKKFAAPIAVTAKEAISDLR